MTDFSAIFNISGWSIGLVGFILAVYEFRKRRSAEETLDRLRESSFSQTLRNAVEAALPNFDAFKLSRLIPLLATKYAVDYLEKVTVGDQSALLDFWGEIGVDLGRNIAQTATHSAGAIPQGLSECSSFLFISQFSPGRARAFFRQVREDSLQQNIARYYYGLTSSPNTFDEILSRFRSCSDEEATGLLAKLRGDETGSFVRLLQSEKWSKRIAARMKEVLRNRKVSYNALANKVIETNPIPRLYLLFKNEGTEPEEEENESGMRPIQRVMRELRDKGEATLISSTAPIYFLKDGNALGKVMEGLPQEDSNYVVFSGAIDPLSMNVKTSDRLDGHPARIYENLLRFRDYKEIYESIALRLGLSPSEIIDTADLGFLLEPKTEELGAVLSKNSRRILDTLSEFTHRQVRLLTDLRNLDDDDVGFLGSTLAKICNLTQVEGRRCAERIASQSKELYDIMYSSTDSITI